MVTSVAVVGLGNILFGDEGLGVYALKYLEANYRLPDEVTLLDGAVLGFGLMPVLHEYERTLVVSSAFIGTRPGEITLSDAEAFMAKGAVRKSANEAELTMMLEICAFSDAIGGVELVTMVPASIDKVRTHLSKTVADALPHMVERLIARLRDFGITVEKKKAHTDVADIVAMYANPTHRTLHTSAG